MTIRFAPRASALTAASIAAIFVVSSIPFLTTWGGPLFRLACNLLHAPVYAVLALLWINTFTRSGLPFAPASAAAFVASVTCGAFDEWHQSFVRGRSSSARDLLVDTVGITCMLAILWMMHRGADARSDSSLSIPREQQP
jgi:VanZ like family